MACIVSAIHSLPEAMALVLQLNLQEHRRLFPETADGGRAMRTVYLRVKRKPVPRTEAVHEAIRLAVQGLGYGAFEDPEELRADAVALRDQWLRWQCAAYGKRFLAHRLDAASVADSEEELLMATLERLEARLADADHDDNNAAAEHAEGAGTLVTKEPAATTAEHDAEHERAEGAGTPAAEEPNAGGTTTATAEEHAAAEEHAPAEHSTEQANELQDAAAEEHAGAAGTADAAAAEEHAPDEAEPPADEAAAEEPDEAPPAAEADADESTAGSGGAARTQKYLNFLKTAQEGELCQKLHRRLRWPAARALWWEQSDPRKALKALNEVLTKAQQEPLTSESLSRTTATAILIDLAEKRAEGPPIRPGCPRCRWQPSGCTPSCLRKAAAKAGRGSAAP